MKRTISRIIIKILSIYCIFYVMFFVLAYEVWRFDQKYERWVIPDAIITNESNIKENLKERKKLKIVENINTNKDLIRENYKNYKIVESIVNSSIKNQHWIGDDIQYDEKTLESICKSYKTICWLTYFYGYIEPKDKLKYQAIIIYIITKLNTFLKYDSDIIDVLNSITIKISWEWLRWYAWAHTVTINLIGIKSYWEFREVLTHELWHIVDLWIMKGKSKSLHNRFTEFWYPTFSIDDPSLKFYSYSRENEKTKLKTMEFKDFVSGYWMSDPFEDFAESFNLYLNHKWVFKKMSESSYILSQKYLYIEKILSWNSFFTKTKWLDKINKDSLWRPWDTTKIINK